MKILLVNKFLYPKGGDAICTLDTGKLLSQKEHQVSYWGMNHSDNPDYKHENLFVDYVDLVNGEGFRRQVKTVINILYSCEAKCKIQKLIELERPDIVHLNNFAHQISPSILDIFKKYNIATVMTMHDYKLVCPTYTMFNNGQVCEECKDGKFYHCFINKCTHNSRVKSLVNTLEMYLHHKLLDIYNKIDIFISPSMFLRDKLREMGFVEKVVYLPNFMRIEQFTPCYEPKENAIVYVGRLSHEKGVETLMKSVKGLDVQLKIIGDGPLKESLKDKKEKLDNVEFLGYRSGDNLKNEIKRSIGLVLPSECYENNPRAIIEAFALGKPVIGTKIGGIPELVKDGRTGYTFESGNPGDLRNKIKSLLDNPDKAEQMGRNARVLVEKEYNAELHYERLMKIYNDAITMHKRLQKC